MTSLDPVRGASRRRFGALSRVVRRFSSRVDPRRVGVRNRILVTFLGGSFVLGLVATLTTYGVTRTRLVEQQEEVAVERALLAARRAGAELAGSPSDLDGAVARAGGAPRLVVAPWSTASSSGLVGTDDVPAALLERVHVGRVAASMVAAFGDGQAVVVGVPLATSGASYFEFSTLDGVNSSLDSLRTSLAFSLAITAAVGAILAMSASRGAVRPLSNAAQAARAIADGRLDTRLEATDDPDLRALTSAFNDMARSLQDRVDRDVRFASNVSHELRSPLMTLAASVEVMQSRRDELPERSRAALDLLAGDVDRFRRLVEDLLEISRYDAGAVRLLREPLVLTEFVRQAVAASSLPATPVAESGDVATMVVHGDRRRLARVVANLIDNARVHGGSRPTVTVQPADGEPPTHAQIVVTDEGDGLIEAEAAGIFERFSRGGTAGRRAKQDGAGLGLALALEHVALHGGRIWAANRTDGIRGARFVVELPIEVRHAAYHGDER